jgi:hypothetical protein
MLTFRNSQTVSRHVTLTTEVCRKSMIKVVCLMRMILHDTRCKVQPTVSKLATSASEICAANH